ncbi:MAG: YkgJ family cysteine cluster protein [Patescibacteria group bacterium]
MKKRNCSGCDECCRYVAIELDKPTDQTDRQNIIWFLKHKNVKVYIGFDNKWYLEFSTPCKELDRKGWCKDYDNRPQICREYDQKDCTGHSLSSAEKVCFTDSKEFKKYLEKKKIKLS